MWSVELSKRCSVHFVRTLRFESLEDRRVLATPTINILSTDVSSELGPDPAVFGLTRTLENIDQALVVNVSYSGTATFGIDYRFAEQQAVFEPGSTEAFVSVLPTNDALAEPVESIVASLVASPEYQIGSLASATVPLVDQFTSGLPGVIDALEPTLPADIIYFDSHLLSNGIQQVFTATIGFANFAFGSPVAFEVYVDADRNPTTGDVGQGHIGGAEYRFQAVAPFDSIFLAYRLPTQIGQEEEFIGTGNIQYSGNFAQLSIDNSMLGSPTNPYVMAFARRNQSLRVAGNGDRAPDFGWLEAGTGVTASSVVAPRAAATTFRTVTDNVGDVSNPGLLDIVSASIFTLIDQVIVGVDFNQGFDPTAVTHPFYAGLVVFDSDRSLATGGINDGSAIPSVGGDAALQWQFSNGVAAHSLTFDPSGRSGLVFGEANSDGRWGVQGNSVTFALSISAIDPFIVSSLSLFIEPPGTDDPLNAVTRVTGDGRMRVSFQTVFDGSENDSAPDNNVFYDTGAGSVVARLEYNQPVQRTDPLESLNPISPVDFIGVQAEIVRDHLVVSGVVASFLNTTVGVNYNVLIDTNADNAVDLVLGTFAIDGGITQVTFANLAPTNANGAKTLHEAMVRFQTVAVAGQGGGFTVSLPLDLVRDLQIPIGNQMLLQLTSNQIDGAGNIDLAPDLPFAIAVPTLTGDYNGDGIVNIGDYDTWRADFGSTATLRSDGNGDEVVNIADYNAWRDSLNDSASIAGTEESEPSSLAFHPLSLTKAVQLASKGVDKSALDAALRDWPADHRVATTTLPKSVLPTEDAFMPTTIGDSLASALVAKAANSPTSIHTSLAVELAGLASVNEPPP